MDIYELKKLAGLPAKKDDLIKSFNNKTVKQQNIVDEDCNTSLNNEVIPCPYCHILLQKDQFYDHSSLNHMDVMGQNISSDSDIPDNQDDTETFNDPTGELEITFQSPEFGRASSSASMGMHEKSHEGEEDAEIIHFKKPRIKPGSEEEEKKNGKKEMDEQAIDATIWDVMAKDRDESPDPYYRSTEKISVPANVKSDLEREISELRKAAEKIKHRNFDTAEFYINSANAMQEVLDHLNQGDVTGMQQAQITLTKMMSPIAQNFPDSAWDFVVRGGKPKSVAQLFKNIREK